MHSVSRVSGRRPARHPEFHRGADRKVNTIGHEGNGDTSQPEQTRSVFEFLQLCANVLTIAVVRGPGSLCDVGGSALIGGDSSELHVQR